MRNRFVACALVLLTGLLLGYAQTPSRFAGTIILGSPADCSVTVNVRSDSALEVYFEYGSTSSTYTAQTNPVASAVDPYVVGGSIS